VSFLRINGSTQLQYDTTRSRVTYLAFTMTSKRNDILSVINNW